MKELYLATPQPIHDFLAFVGSYQLFGVIPLDIIAHLTVSITITLLLLRFKKNYLLPFCVMLIIGLLKEYYDSFAMTNSMGEHIKDMCMNLLYPTVRYVIHRIKLKKR